MSFAPLDDLFDHIPAGELPGKALHYNDADPLGKLFNAIRGSATLGQTPLPTPPAERSWRDCWTAALGKGWGIKQDLDRKLHLAAVESRVLADLRFNRWSGEDEARLRAFLHLLGCPHGDGRGYDEVYRWLPCDAPPGGDWVAHLLRLSGELTESGPRHEVIFPGVWKEELKIHKGLIRARVTRLSSPSPDTARPRLLLAPWTHYLLRPADTEQLSRQLDLPDHLGDGRFLLELLPLWESLAQKHELDGLSPGGLVVEGQSLGLAVVLAAWAACTRLWLPPFIATGQLLNGHIYPVEYVYEKSDFAGRFLLLNQGAGHRFLVPLANASEVESLVAATLRDRVHPVEPALNLLLQNEILFPKRPGDYLAHLQQRAEAEAAGLFSDEDAPDAFTRMDQDWLDGIASAMRDADEGAVCATALPFGNDPRSAVRYLLGRLTKPGPSEPIPLPLLLADESAASPRERLARRVERAWVALGEGPRIGAEVLRNLLSGFGDQLVLVAHAGSSHDPVARREAARIAAEVRGDVNAVASAARVLLLASDGHHFEWLCDAGGVERLARPEETVC